MNEITQTIIDTFEIPEDLAKELSNLLTKQTIRERLLQQLISDTEKFNQIEKDLIPVTARIEAIKIMITRDYVPEKYNDPKYQWNYDGWEVDQNRVQIIEMSVK